MLGPAGCCFQNHYDGFIALAHVHVPAESVRLARSLRVHNPWAEVGPADGQHGRKLAQSQVVNNLPSFPNPGESGTSAAGVRLNNATSGYCFVAL